MSATVLYKQPLTSDGKPIFLPNLFPGNASLYVAGAGDSLVDGKGRGVEFHVASDEAGEIVKSFAFNDWVYLAGGGLIWEGGALGDWVSLELHCPATPVTVNPNAKGNVNLVDVGMGSPTLIVPVPGGSGSHDLDLTKASPVPAFDEDSGVANGYFDLWSEPDEGASTVTPATETGRGKCNLFTVELPLARFVAKMPLANNSGVLDITIPAIKPKKIWPNFVFRMALHNSGHIGLRLAWYLITARVKTI